MLDQWLRFLRTTTDRGDGYILLSMPSHRVWRTRVCWLLTTFLIVYIVLILYCRHAFYHDPTSFFFDPTRGYANPHSSERINQGEQLVYSVNGSTAYTKAHDPQICVGIGTIKRSNTQYVRATVGSLLDGLSAKDRHNIRLVILIAHTEPAKHPVYSEAWVEALSDKILLYNHTDSTFNQLQVWEKEKTYGKKGLYDYRYLLRDCYESNTPWVAILEDDVVAETDWYTRTIQALRSVQAKTHGKDNSNWLYLRLFFTERYLGWNSEKWPYYLGYSLLLVVALGVALTFLQSRCRVLTPLLTTEIIIPLCLVCLPALIGLYFYAGRISMQPLERGVFEMNNYGCCSQGFVFPRQQVPSVMELLEGQQDGLVDMTIEAWAMKNAKSRWAINPSVLQHIGKKSSKGSESDEPAAKIWNFGFEAKHKLAG